eukprot:m.17180 g.17180  ORF g.17180 m.17180 type:complete len:122 (-) comp5410_c0_seq1:638-1003(-)
MTSTAIIAGLGVAAIGITVRIGSRLVTHIPKEAPAFVKKLKMPTGAFNFQQINFYKGGFEKTMNRREAGLILGVSPAASRERINAAHRRIMKANHPDSGGSPYMAAKVNEAKQMLDKGSRR